MIICNIQRSLPTVEPILAFVRIFLWQFSVYKNYTHFFTDLYNWAKTFLEHIQCSFSFPWSPAINNHSTSCYYSLSIWKALFWASAKTLQATHCPANFRPWTSTLLIHLQTLKKITVFQAKLSFWTGTPLDYLQFTNFLDLDISTKAFEWYYFWASAKILQDTHCTANFSLWTGFLLSIFKLKNLPSFKLI